MVINLHDVQPLEKLGVKYHLDVKISSAKTIVDLDVLGVNPRDPPVSFFVCSTLDYCR
jgi:hypothetical protein